MKKYLECRRKKYPIIETYRNLDTSVAEVYKAFKQMEKYGVDSMNQDDVTVAIARNIHALMPDSKRKSREVMAVISNLSHDNMLDMEENFTSIVLNDVEYDVGLTNVVKNFIMDEPIQPVIAESNPAMDLIPLILFVETTEKGTNYTYVVPTPDARKYAFTYPYYEQPDMVSPMKKIIFSCTDNKIKNTSLVIENGELQKLEMNDNSHIISQKMTEDTDRKENDKTKEVDVKEERGDNNAVGKDENDKNSKKQEERKLGMDRNGDVDDRQNIDGKKDDTNVDVNKERKDANALISDENSNEKCNESMIMKEDKGDIKMEEKHDDIIAENMIKEITDRIDDKNGGKKEENSDKDSNEKPIGEKTDERDDEKNKNSDEGNEERKRTEDVGDKNEVKTEENHDKKSNKKLIGENDDRRDDEKTKESAKEDEKIKKKDDVGNENKCRKTEKEDGDKKDYEREGNSTKNDDEKTKD